MCPEVEPDVDQFQLADCGYSLHKATSGSPFIGRVSDDWTRDYYYHYTVSCLICPIGRFSFPISFLVLLRSTTVSLLH